MNNTTHTIRFETPPSRILRFCVGIAGLYAIWACRGFIFHAIYGLSSPEDLGSVTGVVVPLLIEFVIMFGSIFVFIFSIGWRVTADIFSGFSAMAQTWRSRSQAVKEAALAAKESAEAAAGQTAGANAGATAVAAGIAKLPTFEDRVRATLREQRDQMKEQRTQIDSIVEALVRIESTLAAKTEAIPVKTTRTRKATQ